MREQPLASRAKSKHKAGSYLCRLLHTGTAWLQTVSGCGARVVLTSPPFSEITSEPIHSRGLQSKAERAGAAEWFGWCVWPGGR